MGENWADLYRDGRRLNRIIRILESKIKQEKNDEIKLACIDRLIKTTHEKVLIVNMVLGVQDILKEAKKHQFVKN